jgi:hypothetical protein
MVAGHAGGDAAARGAAVDLAVGEDAEVEGGGRRRRVVGEDRAVEEAEIGLVRVRDRDRGAHRIRDRGRNPHEIGDRGREEVEAEGGRRQDRVEGAAIGDVEPHRPEACHRDVDVAVGQEGGNALEGALDHAAPLHPARHLDDPAGKLEGKARLGLRGRHLPALHEPAPERDRGVAAHGGIALVVHEQGRGGGVGCEGLHRDDAVHARMAARLQHEGAAQMVEPLPGLPPLVQDGGAGEGRIAAGHDPDRLARGVHVGDVKVHGAASAVLLCF